MDRHLDGSYDAVSNIYVPLVPSESPSCQFLSCSPPLSHSTPKHSPSVYPTSEFLLQSCVGNSLLDSWISTRLSCSLVIVWVGGLKGKTEENCYFPMMIISLWSSFFLHEFLLSSSFCYSLWAHLSKRYKCKTVRWMNWEPVIDREVSQKEKNKYLILTDTHTHIYNLEKWYWWTYLQGRNGDIDVKNKVLSPDSIWTLSVKPIKII